jgi:hypothetical protein
MLRERKVKISNVCMYVHMYVCIESLTEKVS